MKIRTPEDYKRIFKLFQKLNDKRETILINRPNGRYGILSKSSTDEYSLKYKSFLMRYEILKSFLLDKLPNWYCAFYLPYEECERRNNLQWNKINDNNI